MTPAALAVIRPAALLNNLAQVRRHAPGCRVLAVVKANAYGHGLAQVARILDTADGFAVARLEEGLQLRDAGISSKIVVLGGVITGQEARQASAAGLDLVVHSIGQIDLLEIERRMVPIEVWLKIDSGMGRLGLPPVSVRDAIARLRACGAVAGQLRLMTHLAAADLLSDASTEQQLHCFAGAIGNWEGDVSVANSAAILRWPGATRMSGALNYTGDNWVRPGLMLYGVSPIAGECASEQGLMPAMSFETRLIAINAIQAGRRIGYGGDWRAARDSVIGVAAVGYGDGYPWHVAHDTPVLVNGRPARVVGRVSMDLITIDLTDLSGYSVGDPVVLWGDQVSVADVARCAGRIPYELLASVSPRVTRRVEETISARVG